MSTEFLLRARFVGCSQRKDRNDATKVYCNVAVATAAKQIPNQQVGASVGEYNAEPHLFQQFAVMKFGDPLTLVLDEIEWTKDGVIQNRKTVIGIEPPAK